MNSLFSQSNVASGCLFSCRDDFCQSVVYALMESSQTSLPQKTRNKQNINFRLKRIELGPKQTTKKTDEMRSSKNGDKISIKKLLNSLHSKYQYFDSHQNLFMSTECDLKADTAYFNSLLSRTNREEPFGTNNKKSQQLWNNSSIIKKHETLLHSYENHSNFENLDLQKKQLDFYKNHKLGAELHTLRSYQQNSHGNNEYTSKMEFR